MSSSEEKKSNRLSYISVTLGIFGIFLAAYFYQESIREREPFFVTDPVRTEILKSAQVQGVPIKVTRTNGSEIKSDLNSLRFYLWNNGKESIRDTNVLQKISIRIDDPNARIIYPTTLKVSREVTGISVAPDPQDPERVLLVSFKILEKNDGTTCQIIYEGRPDARLVISGVIEGTKGFRSEEFFQHRTRQAGYIAISVILALILASLAVSLRTSLQLLKNTSRPIRKNRLRIILIVIHIAVFATLTYVFYYRNLETIRLE
jgi:hypothetical protein